MSLVVDVATEGVRIPLARARVADIARAVLKAEKVSHAMLSIAFVTPRRIAALNREHLGHRGPTDVISFHFKRAAEGDPVVGDVYVCPDVARASAARLGVGVRHELARLVVHGTLHVLGHEHPEDDSREDSAMWRRQERLVGSIMRRGR